MPAWMRVAAALVLSLIAVAAMVPLGYAAHRLFEVRSGDALRYGVRVEPAAGAPLSDADRDRAVAVLGNRLAQLGIDRPLVAPSAAPGETVEVVVPSVQDPERVKKLLQAESNLELKPVAGDSRIDVYPTPEAATQSPDFDPARHEVLPYLEREDEPGAGPAPPAQYLVVEKRAVVRGEDLRDAKAVPDQFQSTNFTINFTLRPAGAEQFGAWTGENVGRDLAIVLDGQVRSAPRIQSRIADRGQITGRFTREQAEDLANVLTSGQLPGRATLVSEAAVKSNRWRFRYGGLAAGFGAAALASGAGALMLVWSAFGRRPAPPRGPDGKALTQSP